MIASVAPQIPVQRVPSRIILERRAFGVQGPVDVPGRHRRLEHRDVHFTLPVCQNRDELVLALAREAVRLNLHRINDEHYYFNGANLNEIRQACPSVPVREGYLSLDDPMGTDGIIRLCHESYGNPKWSLYMRDGELRITPA
jgi:hypothetical protein